MGIYPYNGTVDKTSPQLWRPGTKRRNLETCCGKEARRESLYWVSLFRPNKTNVQRNQSSDCRVWGKRKEDCRGGSLLWWFQGAWCCEARVLCTVDVKRKPPIHTGSFGISCWFSLCSWMENFLCLFYVGKIATWKFWVFSGKNLLTNICSCIGVCTSILLRLRPFTVLLSVSVHQ